MDKNNSQNHSTEKYVGTLTFHEAINYGAVLQAFALQKALTKLGCKTEIINYSCDAIRNSYSKCSGGLKSHIGWALKSGSRAQRQRAFDKFIKDNLMMSKPVKRDELEAFCGKYSSVIVGSDQVWNPELTGNDFTYFLDFMSEGKKKKAYAASIGTKRLEAGIEGYCASLVSDFGAVTFREKSAAEYMRSLTGEEYNVVCDPTLLLSFQEWAEVAVDPEITSKYMLLFSLTKPEPDCLDWAKGQAKRAGLTLVVLHNSALPIAGVINVRGAGPGEFLGWIKNASFVVTNSFHGCCFSIIFERDFYWFKSAQMSKSLQNRSSRIENLLTEFDLRDRAVSAEVDHLSSINYEKALPLIEGYRKSSTVLLNKLL